MSDHAATGHDHADDGHVHVHVHSWKFYAGILGALLFLTILTVAVSYVDIDGILALGREVEGVGAWNLGVAVLIATMKASLVVLFFMHLKEDKRFNALVFVGSLLFIGVFFAYTMNDTNTRGTTGDPYNGVHVDPETGIRAPGGIDGPIPGEELEAGLGGGTAAAAPAPAPAAPAAPAPAEETVEEGADEEAAEDEAPAEEAVEEPAEEAPADEAPAEEAVEEPAEEPPAAAPRPRARPRPAPEPAAPTPPPAPEPAAPEPEPEPEPEPATE